jgi:4-amino-4-deoxychorismate lyase
MKGTCDEVLIACDGYITDTSYSNVALFDGLEWVTPANPLLKGTQRAKLIASGLAKEKEVTISDLKQYKKLVLVNAMLEFDPTHSIRIDSIEW